MLAHASLPGSVPLTDLDAAWAVAAPGPRLRALRVAAERLRDRFASGPRAVAVRTLPLLATPYPTAWALGGAAASPAPRVVLTTRCVMVQFLQQGQCRTLLFNPTDVEGRAGAPAIARLGRRVPSRLRGLLAPRLEPLTEQLARLGVAPEDVDAVAFGDLHAQDLRPVLGTLDGRIPARLPRATLIAPRTEWDEWDDPHPLDREWWVRQGKLGTSPARVALTSGDLALGDGVMLVRTPGRTAGHQTLFLNTDSGVWAVSDGGTCADSWSPMDSRIPGLRSYCRRRDVDVVPHACGPERSTDQYGSMVLERTLVDRVKRAAAFAQILPAGEITPSALSPGLAPTILQRAITHGQVVTRRGAQAGAWQTASTSLPSRSSTKAP